jgi:hypothetical protein
VNHPGSSVISNTTLRYIQSFFRLPIIFILVKNFPLIIDSNLKTMASILHGEQRNDPITLSHEPCELDSLDGLVQAKSILAIESEGDDSIQSVPQESTVDSIRHASSTSTLDFDNITSAPESSTTSFSSETSNLGSSQVYTRQVKLSNIVFILFCLTFPLGTTLQTTGSMGQNDLHAQAINAKKGFLTKNH